MKRFIIVFFVVCLLCAFLVVPSFASSYPVFDYYTAVVPSNVSPGSEGLIISTQIMTSDHSYRYTYSGSSSSDRVYYFFVPQSSTTAYILYFASSSPSSSWVTFSSSSSVGTISINTFSSASNLYYGNFSAGFSMQSSIFSRSINGPVFPDVASALDYISNNPNPSPSSQFVDQPIPYVAGAGADQTSFDASLPSVSRNGTQVNLFAGADNYYCYAFCTESGQIVYAKATGNSINIGSISRSSSGAYAILSPFSVSFSFSPAHGLYYHSFQGDYDISYLPLFPSVEDGLQALADELGITPEDISDDDYYLTLNPGNALYIHFPSDVYSNTDIFYNLFTKYLTDLAPTGASVFVKTTSFYNHSRSLPTQDFDFIASSTIPWVIGDEQSDGYTLASYYHSLDLSRYSNSSSYSDGVYIVIVNPVFNDSLSVDDYAHGYTVNGYNNAINVVGNFADAWFMYPYIDSLQMVDAGTQNSHYELVHHVDTSRKYIGSRASNGHVTFSLNGVDVGDVPIPEDSWGTPEDVDDTFDEFTFAVFGITLPGFPSIVSVWHYVTEWFSSVSSGWSLLMQTWAVLPAAFTVPVYASAVIVIVVGIFRRFIA